MDLITGMWQAAEWWAEQIYKRTSGSQTTALIEAARVNLSLPSNRQITNFEGKLQDEILAYLLDKPWDIEKPRFGTRIIYVDWTPCQQLERACKHANISTLFLPTKTRMWIDPDGIRVSSGREIITLEPYSYKCLPREWQGYEMRKL